MTPGPRRRLDRRQVLRLTGHTAAVGAVAAVAGCSGVSDTIRKLPRPRPRVRADNEDLPLLKSARSDLDRLLGLCEAVRNEHPRTADHLDPVIDHHRRHVDVLGSAPAKTSPSARGPSPSATSPSASQTVPRNRKRALRRVADAEQTAARDRGDDAVAAASGDFARVLAAISAACAQHARELRSSGKGQS